MADPPDEPFDETPEDPLAVDYDDERPVVEGDDPSEPSDDPEVPEADALEQAIAVPPDPDY